MKKRVFLCLVLLLMLIYPLSSLAKTVNNKYLDIDYIKEEDLNYEDIALLLEEIAMDYLEALAQNDVDKLNELTDFGERIIEMQLLELEVLRDAIDPSAATDYSYYFNSSGWITREGVVSLSADPKNLTWNGSQVINAWEALRLQHSADSDWYNEDMLYKQFLCHIKFGYIKTPWNIEPSKTSIHPILCN